MRNEDAGVVRPGQRVRLKLAGFPFQKYGLVEGEVSVLSADAAEAGPGNGEERRGAASPGYRATVTLAA